MQFHSQVHGQKSFHPPEIEGGYSFSLDSPVLELFSYLFENFVSLVSNYGYYLLGAFLLIKYVILPRYQRKAREKSDLQREQAFVDKVKKARERLEQVLEQKEEEKPAPSTSLNSPAQEEMRRRGDQ